MWIAILAVMVPPPSAETLAQYATPEPTFPADAIEYETACGQTIGIVPEELVRQPAYSTELYTEVVSACGMGCCLTPVTRERRVPTGEKTINAPTPLAAVEDALQQIQLSKSDVLYDLGCGDGRVCVLASSIHGCRSVGLDQREGAVSLSARNAGLNDVDGLTRFYKRDVFRSDLKDATVVFVYLDKSLIPQVADLLQTFPNIRKAISYKHAWPRNGRKAGDFYVWTRQERIATKPQPSRGRS